MSVFSRGHHTTVPHPQSQHTFVEVPPPAGKLCALCQCVFLPPFSLMCCCCVFLTSLFSCFDVAVRTSQGCVSRATSAPSAAQYCTRTATSSLDARSSVPAAAALQGARSGPHAACGASTSLSRATTTSHCPRWRPCRRPLPSLTTPQGHLPHSIRRHRHRACRRTSRAAQTSAGVPHRRLPQSHRLWAARRASTAQRKARKPFTMR